MIHLLYSTGTAEDFGAQKTGWRLPPSRIPSSSDCPSLPTLSPSSSVSYYNCSVPLSSVFLFISSTRTSRPLLHFSGASSEEMRGEEGVIRYWTAALVKSWSKAGYHINKKPSPASQPRRWWKAGFHTTKTLSPAIQPRRGRKADFEMIQPRRWWKAGDSLV